MYSEIFGSQAELMKALAHPKRLEIVHLLRDQTLCVSDMQAMLGLPQANLSQHLQILRTAGVLATEKQGKHTFYRLSSSALIQASDLLRHFIIERSSDPKLIQALSWPMKELVPLVHDPVCGMRLSPKTASVTAHYQGQQWYFCATGCYETFLKNPQKYATE